MNLKRRTILIINLLIILNPISLILTKSVSGRTTDVAFESVAEAAMSFDQKTGKIFYAKDPDTKRGIASVTKILSNYLVLEKIHQKKLKWGDKVKISDYPYNLWKDNQSNLSNVPLDQNLKYSVQDLYNASMISSANSCQIALAEKIAGSEPQFVQMMLNKAKSWGIKDIKLINSTGLNNSIIPQRYRMIGTGEDDENMMSARDVAIVAYHLIHDFPEILETSKKTQQKFAVGTSSEVELGESIWNLMLPGKDVETEGVDGLKTGTTPLAGQCFVGTCNRHNQRIVTVVLHADEADSGTATRFNATSALIDDAYNNWHQQKIAQKGQQFDVAKSAPVKDGKSDTVPLVLHSDLKSWARDDYDLKKLKINFVPEKNPLIAPVEKSAPFGKVQISLKDDNFGYLPSTSGESALNSTMETKGTVKRQFFLKVWANHLLNWINSKI